MNGTNSNVTQADIPGGAYPTTAGAAKTISYLLFEQQQFQGKENAVARLYNNRRQVSEFLITLEARDEHGQVTVVPDGTLVDIVPFSTLQGRWPAATGPHEKGYLPFDESFAFGETDSAESQALRCSPGEVFPNNFLPMTKPELHTIQSSEASLIQRKTFKRYLTNDGNPGGFKIVSLCVSACLAVVLTTQVTMKISLMVVLGRMGVFIAPSILGRWRNLITLMEMAG